MNSFEETHIELASIAIENADALMYDFFEDYIAERGYKTLIYEAESRPDILHAKVWAIMRLLADARLHVEAAIDPKHSKVVEAYIKEAEELKAHALLNDHEEMEIP